MVKISLRAARVNAGLSQKEVAISLGISNKTLSNWENGDTFPSVEKINRLCELYHLSYDEINFLPEKFAKSEHEQISNACIL